MTRDGLEPETQARGQATRLQRPKPPCLSEKAGAGPAQRDGEGARRLKQVVERYRSTRARGVTLDERPGCVYGMLTREEVDDLVKEIEELKGTLNKIYLSLVLMLVGLVVNALLEKLGGL